MGKSKAAGKINIKSFARPWCYKNKLILRHRLRTLAFMINWEITLEITKKNKLKGLNQTSNFFTLCLHMQFETIILDKEHHFKTSLT